MSLAPTVALVILVIVAAVYDLRFRKIPNWVNASGVVLGLGLSALAGPQEFKASLFGMACALAVYFPLYLLRGMGAGDVKLMAAVGSLAGPGNWVLIFLMTALLGGAASLLLVLYRRAGRQTAQNLGLIVAELARGHAPSKRQSELDIRNPRALRLPHGAVIAAGALLFTAGLRLR